MRYPPERKESVLRKMMPPHNRSERFEKQDGLPILEFLQNFLRRKLNIKSTACRVREKRVTYPAFRPLFRAHF